MRRRTPLAAAILVIALAAGAPFAVARVHHDPSHPRLEAVQNHYLRLHAKVVKKFGAETAGRNIVIDGYRTAKRVRLASRAEVQASVEQLDLTLHPPPPPTPEVAAESAVYASSGYTIPESIVMCESGGDYSAVNPSSGAGGAYQILPSTWATYGGSGAPQEAPPAEQDRIAAEIYADSGGEAWVC